MGNSLPLIMTYSIAGETRSSWQCDEADVRRAGAGDGLVDDEGAVLHGRALRLLQLPKLLQFFHNIDCNYNK